MTAVINIMIFVFLMAGFWGVTGWLWEVGVQEILIYTESFLLEEAEKLRVKVLPEITSTRPLDKLELLLYYSGIRNYFPPHSRDPVCAVFMRCKLPWRYARC